MGPDPGDRRALSAFHETAHAKLNLALHVRGRLSDGRHRIETIFAFCEDGDELGAQPHEHVHIHVQGPMADQLAGPGQNLVSRAATMLMLEKACAEPNMLDGGAWITLDKRLPVAAGLGGGSADAAAALRLLTRMWNLGPVTAEEIAPRLGADVPACLLSRPCRGCGAGDEIEPIELAELKGKPVLLVNPGVPLATADVFAAWDGIDRGPLTDWRHGRNDLEAPAIALVPEIDEVLQWMRARPGAEFVRMSGSGATCFALFGDAAVRDRSAESVPGHWWHMATRLR
ncbi:MAG TPA: 4-(cytidine 5'-diphospho)-2-C-methyl-D-erythritol kinase [Sphingomicrobium sp.]|jgi:4-diphosphocytidyl-2-C-methyl-D-erythritol kinase|nr:4-(cytidine 5'-diphospho)-2-C-methyl-D-erythritol kinase [Sphingomicrobium sp.]